MTAALHAGHLDRSEDLQSLAVHDRDRFTVAHIEELLLLVGENATERANSVSGLISCLMNLPSLVNIWTRRFSRSATYTMPSLATRSECTTLSCCGPGASKLVLRKIFAMIVVLRLVGEGAPRSLERAGVGIEDDDAVVAVAVGYEQLVGRRIDLLVGRTMKFAVSALPLLWLRGQSA